MRLFIILLCFLTLLSCSKEDTKIAVLISGEGRMSKVRGFEDGLRALGVKNIKLDVYVGDNNLKKLEEKAIEVINKLDEYKLIAVGGSIEAYYLKKLKPDMKKPVVIMGGTAVKAWGLTDSMSRPTYNITGVDNLNAELMEKRMEIFHRIFPHIKKVVVFCTPQFEASKLATRITVKAGEKYGIRVVPVSVRDALDLEYVISHMKEDGFGGIIITPCFYTENFLTSYILQYANFYQVPVMCLSPEQAKGGCPVSYGSSGYEQGYQAAFIAYRLLKGEQVKDVPFEKVRNIKLVINQKALRELGIPYDPQIISLADQVLR
ncbi:MAG: ABC transporter substrate-binding protein [Hydrogenobacter thermophilus]|uniref:ABC transporter substrate binding protein n=1 Tax=Hydrogenobacter thermophilus TaxID=940 RepID=UPI001C754A40|nr:ABC transporter substrate binding protein [Hydrogenobacter thermophilus]QWK19795.1 MAG: ABC transporter substrate-binding protein [Hydrogenobacter thermophilus]